MAHLHDSSSAVLVSAFYSQDSSFSRQPQACNVQASPDQTPGVVPQIKNEGVTPLVLYCSTSVNAS